MRLHILVEGSSEERLLNAWLPRMLPGHRFTVIPHQGKGRLSAQPQNEPKVEREGLLDQLPAKLRAYGKVLDPSTDRVVVLVDLDKEPDCVAFKRRLEHLLELCDPKPVVLFRLAIEETESFYLGDREAIRAAFPGSRLSLLDSYKPDSICGAWELFQKVVRAPVDDKVGWAEKIGPVLGTKYEGNRANLSESFRQLCTGLKRLVGEAV